MNFLAPWYLVLAAGVAVPLLVHLLRRRIGTHVPFPATRYLARAERDHSRTLKLRNLLLMLLRVAILAAVALAAARPAAWLGGGGHAPTAMAIVIDNSLSSSAVVSGKPVIDELRSVAHRVIAAAAPGDRVWLVTADGQVRGGTPMVLARELDALEPLAGAGNPAAALARGAALVRSSGIASRSVVLLTDGQRTTWQRSSAVANGVSLVVWMPTEPPPRNAAVVEARAEPPRWTPRGAVVARVESKDSITYRMTLGGRTFARGTAASGEDVTVTAAPAERGWQSGTVEIEPDEMPADNVRHFAVWIGPATGVTALPGAGSFVASALDVLRGSQRIAAGQDASVAAADEVTALPALIAAPSDPSRLGVANRALAKLDVPWRFGAIRRDSSLARAVPGALAGADDVSVAFRYQLQPVAGAAADTLANVGAEPWIVGGPRYVLVGSPLTPEASSLPVSAAFLPWLTDVFTQRLSGEAGQVIYTSPRSALPAPRWADGIELPDGSRAPIEPSSVLTSPTIAGTYFLDHAGRRVGALVVNPPAEESQLDRFTLHDLAARLGGARPASTPAVSDVARSAFAAAARRSLVPLLLGIAALLLLAESWMSSGWVRRAGARV